MSDTQGQPRPSISTGKEVLLPHSASRGKRQTSEGKKKLKEKTPNIRNKIRQTTHTSPQLRWKEEILLSERESRRNEVYMTQSILPEFRKERVKVQEQNISK